MQPDANRRHASGVTKSRVRPSHQKAHNREPSCVGPLSFMPSRSVDLWLLDAGDQSHVYSEDFVRKYRRTAIGRKITTVTPDVTSEATPIALMPRCPMST